MRSLWYVILLAGVCSCAQNQNAKLVTTSRSHPSQEITELQHRVWLLEIKIGAIQEEVDILAKNIESLMSSAWQERVRAARDRAYSDPQLIEDLRTREALLLHKEKALKAVLDVYNRFLRTN